MLYCFPKFYDEAPLQAWTPPSLWSQVWWVRPLAIPVPAPIDTHHHVERTPAGVWNVFSDKPTKFAYPTVDFEEYFVRPLAERKREGSFRQLKKLINSELARRSKELGGPESSRMRRYAASTLAGMQLVGLAG